MTSNNKTILIVTGCNSNFFPNLRILIGSWMEHMQDFQLAICDFGLLKIQIDELNLIEGLRILTSDRKVEEALAGKTMLRSFIGNQLNKFDAIMWIDSDAFFNTRLPEILPILDGYDMLIDAHIQSIGEISDSKNISDFSLRRDDSYFSAGWWVGRPGNFLKRYEEIGQNTRDRHFWEGDAFVSAIYLEKLKIRSINGSIWHSRGKTSLSTCKVIGFTAFHVNQPIYILHANAFYRVRIDGRRILNRLKLARLQDYYEKIYFKRTGVKGSKFNNFHFYFSYLILLKNKIIFNKITFKVNDFLKQRHIRF